LHFQKRAETDRERKTKGLERKREGRADEEVEMGSNSSRKG